MSFDFEKLKREVQVEQNRVRRDPKSYISKLEKILTWFNGDVINKPGEEIGIQTQEGPAVYKECIEFLKKQPVLPELIFDEQLSRSSQDHANDIGSKGLCEHDGSDGSTASDRIERYLEWANSCAENLDFGGRTGEEVIISLIVDDGVPERGHRNNIFSTQSTHFGVACAPHTDFEITTVLNYTGGILSYKNAPEVKSAQNNNGQAKPQAKVEEEKPKARVEEEKPKARVEEEKPKARVEEEKPKAQPRVQQEQPKPQPQPQAKLQEEPKPKSKPQEEPLSRPQREQPRAEPSRPLPTEENNELEEEVSQRLDTELRNDPDTPKNTKTYSTKTVTRISPDGKTHKKTVKVFLPNDGSKVIVEADLVE